MKKIPVLILFSLLSISLFASGHGTNAFGAVILLAEIVGGIAILLLITYIISAGINAKRPRKTRTTVYTVLLCFFTILFDLYFSKILSDYHNSNNYLRSVYPDAAAYNLQSEILGLPPGLLIILSAFAVFFTVIVIFLVIAYRKLKKENNPG